MHLNIIAFYTIFRREVMRIMRIWSQTLLPPVINQSLYFIVFGTLIGSQIRNIDGVSYMNFIVPGLVMMGIINNSFMNVVSSFFGSKFQKNVEEIMVSPTPKWVMLAGYTAGGMFRGLLIGIIVFAVSAFFTTPTVHSVSIIFIFSFLTSLLFSLGGMTMGIFARNFDDVSFVPTFILTPLTYFGGVFYSIKDLPAFWQNISKLNPILYMIDGFRFGFFGTGDVNIITSMSILTLFTAGFWMLNITLLKRGTGMKT